MNVFLAVGLIMGLYMYVTDVPEFLFGQALIGISEPGSPAEFFLSSRRRHTTSLRDWSQTCALPISTLRDAERAHIVRVLDAVSWNKKEAARVLEISRGTLYRKIVEYSLEPETRTSR